MGLSQLGLPLTLMIKTWSVHPESYFPRVVCQSYVVVNRAWPQFFKDAYNKPTERSISTISGPESVFQQQYFTLWENFRTWFCEHWRSWNNRGKVHQEIQVILLGGKISFPLFLQSSVILQTQFLAHSLSQLTLAKANLTYSNKFFFFFILRTCNISKSISPQWNLF